MPNNQFYIPGPTFVDDSILAETKKPMINHRGSRYTELHSEIINNLKLLFNCEDYHVFLVTSSATGLMEGVIRNVVEKNILHTVCGAFSKKWADISLANGKKIKQISVDWGKAIKPHHLQEIFFLNKPEAVTFTHSETSTGVLNPLKKLCQTVRKYSSETLILVDAVSSFGGVPVEIKNWGIDVLLFGVQKCFAVPPGLAIAFVSKRAYAKSLKVKNKGYYFNFEIFAEFNKKNHTPATPALPQLFALRKKLEQMKILGLESIYKRHQNMGNMVKDWCHNHNFDFFAENGYESPTVSALKIRPDLNMSEILSIMKTKGFTLASGYGALKDTTFRIGHLGEHTEEGLKLMLDALTATILEHTKTYSSDRTFFSLNKLLTLT